MLWLVAGLGLTAVAWRTYRFAKRIGSAFHNAIWTEEADMWR